jgi:hypothetical protein
MAKKVFDLLVSDNGIPTSWGDGDKYLIKPNFTNTKFVGGEEIEVLLPFPKKSCIKNRWLISTLFKKNSKRKKLY